MSDVVIRRCPYSKHIRIHAAEVSAGLLLDFNRISRIEDGDKNEFTILSAGRPLLLRSTNWLPSVEEVESSILRDSTLIYAAVGGDETDEWHNLTNAEQ